MIKKYFLVLIVLFSLVTPFCFTQKAHAFEFGAGGFNVKVNPDTPFGEGEEAVNETVNVVFKNVISISQIVFIIMFLIGGIMYLTSMGNDEQTGKARKLMLAAIIGIVIVFAAWAVGSWVINRLKGDTTSALTGDGLSNDSSDGIKVTQSKKYDPGTYLGFFDGLKAIGVDATQDDENPKEFTVNGNKNGIIDDATLKLLQSEQTCLDVSSALYKEALDLCEQNWSGAPAGEYGEFTSGLNKCLDNALENKRKMDENCRSSGLSKI